MSERVVVQMRCAQTRQKWAISFEKRGEAYIPLETIEVLGGGDPNNSGKELEIGRFAFFAIYCPHCGAESGPIQCGSCREFVCKGFYNPSTKYFVCACGQMGFATGTLRHVSVSEKTSLPAVIGAAVPSR
jgi:hypothetical protein